MEKMRKTGHVARTGEGKSVYTIGNLMERNHLRDPVVDGRKILSWIFRMWDVGLWTGSFWFSVGTGGGHL
jgi:hypothetical protein